MLEEEERRVLLNDLKDVRWEDTSLQNALLERLGKDYDRYFVMVHQISEALMELQDLVGVDKVRGKYPSRLWSSLSEKVKLRAKHNPARMDTR